MQFINFLSHFDVTWDFPLIAIETTPQNPFVNRLLERERGQEREDKKSYTDGGIERHREI